MRSQDDREMAPGEFALLDDPLQALAWRCQLIREARHAIDAQYYSWDEDSSGKLLLAELLAAARRGVQVRLLVDDLHSGDARFLPALGAEPNISVRRFNPFRSTVWRPLALLLEVLLRFRRLNHRMHNKLLLIDGRVAIMGGRNIGDRYFGLSDECRFVDLDLLCRGEICRQLERGFQRFWQSRWSQVWPTPANHRGRCEFLLDYLQPELRILFGLPSPLVAAPLSFLPGNGRALFDEPGKGLRRGSRIAALISKILQQAAPRLVLVSPYLVLPPRFMRRLLRLSRRRIRITVLTNSLATTDVPLVQGTYERQRTTLRRHGVRVFELKPDELRSLHAKVVLFGDQGVLLGSFNLDPRSLYLNTEIALQVDSTAVHDALSAWLGECLQLSWPLAMPDESPVSLWRRGWRWLSGRLPIQRWL